MLSCNYFQDVTPATIAMHQGFCRIGLSEDELEDLAIAGTEGRAHKCSTREMSTFLMRSSSPSSSSSKNSNLWGATTVASTMKLAHLAGISTFVTGGSGGVHRGGEYTMDVSADLTELSRTPVVVISAGIKSILDIPVGWRVGCICKILTWSAGSPICRPPVFHNVMRDETAQQTD